MSATDAVLCEHSSTVLYTISVCVSLCVGGLEGVNCSSDPLRSLSASPPITYGVNRSLFSFSLSCPVHLLHFSLHQPSIKPDDETDYHISQIQNLLILMNRFPWRRFKYALTAVFIFTFP